VPYAVLQDLIDRFGEDAIIALTDRDLPPAGVVNEALVDRALADAAATIDGYLQSRYTLPLTTVPAMINVLACDIARYRLMAERPTDEARARFNDAIGWLSNVAMGKFGLGLDAQATAPAENTGPVVSTRPHRTFDDCSLRGFTEQRPRRFP
jgi:phage gp36-like protein